MEETKGSNIDNILLEHFEEEIWSKVPHLEEKQGQAKVVNATPLIDLTEDLKIIRKEKHFFVHVFENNSKGKTFLCTRCEALIVVTHLNLKRVELSSKTNDNIMLKEPYILRKVSY